MAPGGTTASGLWQQESSVDEAKRLQAGKDYDDALVVAKRDVTGWRSLVREVEQVVRVMALYPWKKKFAVTTIASVGQTVRGRIVIRMSVTFHD